MLKLFIHVFHHFVMQNPPNRAREEPSRLTIRAEDLPILVMIIGNSSFKIVNWKVNPTTILQNTKKVKGHLIFQFPSWEAEK